MSYGFVDTIFYRCIYMKVNGSKFIILVLYVDDIILAINDVCLLHDKRKFPQRNYGMKHIVETSYVIGIEIYCVGSKGMLGLSQKGYIKQVLERFRMDKCSPRIVSI